MKRIIILFVFAAISANLMAQVGGIEYNPYIPGQSQPSYQTQTQAQSTTAYSVDMYGNVQSIRIRVAIMNSGQSAYSLGSQAQLRVIARYSKIGLSGAQWVELPTKPIVYQCSPYSNNPLEQRFMYKANMGSGYVYFDL